MRERAPPPAWEGVRREPLLIQLTRTTRLRGRAINHLGEPAAGAIVRARHVDDAPTPGAPEATVEPDGTFELERLAPGRVALVVENVEHGNAHVEVEVALERRNEVELQLVLPHGGPLDGRVVFAEGDRERVGFVALTRDTELFARDLVLAGDFAATFSFRHLPEGRYRLVVYEDDREVMTRSVQVPGPRLELYVE